MEFLNAENGVMKEGIMMDSLKMKKELQSRLSRSDRTIVYDQDEDTLRIESNLTHKGITIYLPGIVAKWNAEKERAIDEVVYYVEEGLQAMEGEVILADHEKKIFPVIRSASFPKASEEGVPFLTDDHTAETRIYYAYDMGKTYRLIDDRLLEKEGWTAGRIKEIALFNVRSLSTKLKEDHVAGNVFYFLNMNDGYDASRILNKGFLNDIERQIKGTMVLAVPHQDVLIVADVQNNAGYDILAQMAMSFFASGRVPIPHYHSCMKKGNLSQFLF